MMKRLLTFLLALAAALPLAAQSDAAGLKALVDSNRVSFKYTLSAKDRPQIATGGTVVLDGQDITSLPEYKRSVFLGRVFQDPMMG